MAKARHPLIALRSAAGPAAGLLFVAFFGYSAVLGPNGVVAWRDYAHKLELRRSELAQLESQKRVVANRVALLDPRRADPDMVDELVRRDLGVAGPDEVIVPLR